MGEERWGFELLGVAVVVGVLGLVLGVSDETAARLHRVVGAEPRPMPAWGERLGGLDAAIAEKAWDRAIHEWRVAYRDALSSMRWDALAEVADRALRIDELGGGSTGYREKARGIYRFASFRARAAQSPEGVQRLSAALAALERADLAERARSVSAPTWETHLGSVNNALQRGDLSTAVYAWHYAYGAALGSRSWEAMVAAGDAVVRIGQAAGSVDRARDDAAEAYRVAFLRARKAGSADGLLRVAAGLRSIGDLALADQSIHAARQLANDRVAEGAGL